MKAHQELLTEAIEQDGVGQRALLQGDETAAGTAFRAASELYRRSWEAAPPGSYGRLVGMLKSAILAGDGDRAAAAYVTATVSDAGGSPTAAYALALAALVAGDDVSAGESSAVMRGGGEAFERTAEAIDALASGERDRYAIAVRDIVRDFEQRSAHLTDVAIADTALALERLAARRSLAAGVQSELLPAS